MENISYVYRLINPIDNQVFYIGSGRKDRIRTHWISFLKHDIQSCRNNYDKYCILKSIKEAGLKPIEEIITKKNMSPEVAEKLETKYILSIGRLCNGTGPLVNIKVYQRCPMRDPETAKKVSITKIAIFKSERGKVLREHQSKLMKIRMRGENHWNYGRTITSKQREILLKARKGVKLTEDHKQKLSKSHKGKYMWVNNGSYNDFVSIARKLPNDWVKGRLKKEIIPVIKLVYKQNENFYEAYKRCILENELKLMKKVI